MPVATVKSDRRVQFDLSENMLESIEKTMEICDIPTKKDFLNNAATAFMWMVEEIQAGRLIVSADKDKDDFEVFWMPSLKAAARRAAPSKSRQR